MGKERHTSFLHLLFCLFLLPVFSTSATFEPPDNFLLDCGSTTNTTVFGRTFLPDTPPTTTTASSWSLSAPRSTPAATTSTHVSSFSSGPLLRTARVFVSTSSYTFSLSVSTSTSRHFLRLHFLPFVTSAFNLTQAHFSLSAQLLPTQQHFPLLSSFSTTNTSNAILKEYLLPTSTSTSLVLTFTPTSSSSFAFVNAIELVSTPSSLFADSARYVDRLDRFSGLNSTALETAHRLNMGGHLLTPSNDTLSRKWLPDQPFLLHPNLAHSTSYPGTINYPDHGATQQTAPPAVYSTATEMATAGDGSDQNFNVTWTLDGVDSSFPYLLRLHFCDIVSNASNQLFFYVYVAGHSVVPGGLDLSTFSYGTLASPYYLDLVASITDGSGSLTVSIGPSDNVRVVPNAILNGLELLKMNNSLGSLAGLASSKHPSYSSSKTSAAVVAVGIALAVFGVSLAAGVAFCLVLRARRRRRRTTTATTTTTTTKQKELLAAKRNPKQSSDNWRPLPVLFSSSTTTLGAHPPPPPPLLSNGPSLLGGYSFSLATLMEATNNFDEELVIGVGGFGKVYRGTLVRDGSRLAVKRANRGSQQGLIEFRTEIELLSQLRHRHLVSLIGFCNEGGEMILVYEYMEKGTLRSHLYGSADLPPLTWKQRLEICIGAARGLHYLHTGQRKAIIHRDVKSANILLDDALRAKVSDFGLSKTGPELDKTHVSTAVKGSFGYLDPDYFRRQQLTEKSDVYSFGVVLLEVLCARPVIDPSLLPREMVNLAEWAMKLRRQGQLERAIDPLVLQAARPDSLAKFVETAEKCLAEYGAQRPTMGDVLWNLEAALQLQEAREEESLNGDAAGEEHIRDSTPLARNVLNSSELDGSFAAEGQVLDLPGLTMSRVFSQLVKAEAADSSWGNSFSHH